MNGRDLVLGSAGALALGTTLLARRGNRGSRDAASEQAADYYSGTLAHRRGHAVRQSGEGIVSRRFPSWTSVRRRLQRDGFTHEGSFDALVEMFDVAADRISEREKIRRAWAEVEGDWKTFTRYAWDFTDPIRVWRAVTADSLETLHLPPPTPPVSRRTRQVALPFPTRQPAHAVHAGRGGDGAGIWWSWDPWAAEAHWGGSHARGFLLAGEVAYGDVNWPATFYANLTSADEREIQVKPGAPVHLLRVRDDDTGVVERQDLWVRA